MTSKRIIALAIAVLTIIMSIPMTASAASAEVEDIDGEKTVFLSSFGKVTYNGKSHTAFKTYDEAVKALGSDGGRIVFTGDLRFPEFKDEKHAPIKIVGVGTNAQGNKLIFSDSGDIEFNGEYSFGFLNIANDENAFIYTNGNRFMTLDGFDTHHTETFVEGGANIIQYKNPPSIAVGKTDNGGKIYLEDGHYVTVSAGSANGREVKGDTDVTVNYGIVNKAVAGNVGNGKMTGNAKLTVNGGEIAMLTAGSEGGTFEGNITTEINGGVFTNVVVGAEAGAVVNGNVVVAFNGGNVLGISQGSGKVNGKTIFVSESQANVDIGSTKFDYIMKMENGRCDPAFDGQKLTGFRFTDKYGVPATEITLDGKTEKSETGMFALSEGTHTVGVTTCINLGLDKNANYVAGYEDGTFLPQKNMTKAEAMTLLSRLITSEDYIKKYIKADYDDVSDDAWYSPYIGLFQKLGFLGLVEKDYGTKICPDELITRGEFTQLIFEVDNLGKEASATKLKNFTDVSATNKNSTAICYAASTGLVAGYEDGTFRPANNITRAEVVTMVNRMLGRNPTGKPGDTTFKDIESHWAYSQILAACNPENVSWTKGEGRNAKYKITGTCAKDYITALYDQSATLSGEEIRNGVDIIAEQMKKDILGSKDAIDTSKYKKVIYVSEKHGNDENDGSSPEKALKTLSALTTKVKLLRDAAVLFERGGIYRGQISIAQGCAYGAYGEGDKPLIMQSRKNYANESLWIKTEYPNVWRCADKLINVGVAGFDHDLFDYSENSYHEKYGQIRNIGIDREFKGAKDLKMDLEFFSDTSAGVTAYGDFYLYSVENPGKRFKSIELGERVNIMSSATRDNIIENLAFKFTGAHAIGVGNVSNFQVRNCVFSWLGGSLLTESFFGGSPVNYGNAVETGVCNGYYVDDCWMYQIYDTAVTHQCSAGTGSRIQLDVRYSGNLMEYVHWGIEFYNSPDGATSGDRRLTDGVYDAYNVCRLGGYGWGSIVRGRQGSAQLYCGSSLSENKNELTEYNIFDRCLGNLLSLPNNSKEVDDKNIYIQTRGKRLGRLRGTDVICDDQMAYNLEKFWGDKNAVAIIIEPER